MYDSYVPTCMTLSSVSSLCGSGLFPYKMPLLSASSLSLDTSAPVVDNSNVSRHSGGELIHCAAHKLESHLLLCC